MRVETIPSSSLKDVMKINEVMSVRHPGKNVFLWTLSVMVTLLSSGLPTGLCSWKWGAQAGEFLGQLRRGVRGPLWAQLITRHVLVALPLLPSLLSTEGWDNTALTHDPKGTWEMNEFVFVKRMGPWIKSSVKPRDTISIPGFCFFSFLLKGYSLSLSLSQDF